MESFSKGYPVDHNNFRLPQLSPSDTLATVMLMVVVVLVLVATLVTVVANVTDVMTMVFLAVVTKVAINTKN